MTGTSNTPAAGNEVLSVVAHDLSQSDSQYFECLA